MTGRWKNHWLISRLKMDLSLKGLLLQDQLSLEPVVDNVAPYSALENILVQKLTTEYKIGMERLVKSKTPPMKASELWQDKPAVLLCI